MFFYPLTDKRHSVIVAEIAERRAAIGSSDLPLDPSLSTASFRAHRVGNTTPQRD